MALNEKKITAEEIAANGVVSADDILSGNAQENKAVFDRLVREVVSVKFNEVIDELISAAGAGQIGAVDPINGVDPGNVQQYLGTLKNYIDNKVVDAGAMTSFNGRAGDVVPLLGDYTAAMVGAAPAGFGIGNLDNYSISTDAELYELLENQILSMGDHQFKRFSVFFTSTENVTSTNAGYSVEIYTRSTNRAFILLKSYVGSGRELRTTFSENEFGEWEWINPPCSIGREYRTTERFNGNAVYIKTINCGTPPKEAGGKTIAHGISGCRPIECIGNLGGNFALPYISASGAKIDIAANQTNIIVYASYNTNSTNDIIVRLKYYKA